MIHLLILILVIWLVLQLFGQLGVGLSQPVLIIVLLVILLSWGGYGYFGVGRHW